MIEKHAIIIGANGLVGKELTKELVNDPQYTKVTLIARREIELYDEKLHLVVIDFRQLHKYWNEFSCDDMYYCLGTTRNSVRKKSDFIKIEHDYCVNIAKIAQHNKVRKFMFISSKGANTSSWFLYPRTKGQIEQNLMQIGFPILHIFRPSVLMGKREEFRFFEAITIGWLKIFNFMMIGYLKNIKGMPVPLLVKYMDLVTKDNKMGIFIHSNKQIHNYFSKKNQNEIVQA